MSEMAERVANAIRAKHQEYDPTPHDYQYMAEAAIAAMREPTDDMMVAAETAVPTLASFADKQDSRSYRAWQAMVDAALAVAK